TDSAISRYACTRKSGERPRLRAGGSVEWTSGARDHRRRRNLVMRVITFYSYKGGVGRTLACANFGIYLAKTGQKVVLADMDFESPGLDSKFFSDATTNISNGLLDQITAFQHGKPLPNLS